MKYLHSAVLGVFIAVTLLLSQAQTGLAQATGSLEIHKRICPADTVGNLFDQCHDNLPEQTVTFTVDGGAGQDVDANGNVVFSGLAAGSHAVSETEGPPLDFVNLRVFCSVQTDNPEVFEVTTDGPNFSVDVGAGEAVVCDVYNIAENLSGLTPEPTAVATTTPGVVLPNTGSGFGTGGTTSTTPLFALLALLGALAMIALGWSSRKNAVSSRQ